MYLVAEKDLVEQSSDPEDAEQEVKELKVFIREIEKSSSELIRYLSLEHDLIWAGTSHGGQEIFALKRKIHRYLETQQYECRMKLL